MEWFSVKDKLPKHLEIVLASNEKNEFVVCIFIDRETAIKELTNAGFNIPDKFFEVEVEGEGESIDDYLYNFCSIEIRGNVFNWITHWAYIKGPI